MQSEDMTRHSKAANDYINLSEKTSELPKPKLTAKEEYWRWKADGLALKANQPMVVVNNGGSCQVWNKSIADKCGAEYDYVAGGSE